MVYYQHIGVTHVAHIYRYNEWGIYYNTALRQYALEFHIQLQSFPQTLHQRKTLTPVAGGNFADNRFHTLSNRLAKCQLIVLQQLSGALGRSGPDHRDPVNTIGQSR